MKINYVSWLSNELGKNSEEIKIDRDVSILELLSLLEGAYSQQHKYIFKDPEIVRASVNGKLVEPGTIISNNAEVTLFAPMSGG